VVKEPGHLNKTERDIVNSFVKELKEKPGDEIAEDALQQNHFTLTVNRSYYALFTPARALLTLEKMGSSKHSGVIA